MINKTLKSFKQFKKYGSFVTNESTAKTIWDEVIEPIWEKYCSVNPTDDKFFPTHFFSPFDEKWYRQDNHGDYVLIFDTDEEEWRVEQKATASFNSNDIYKSYDCIKAPY